MKVHLHFIPSYKSQTTGEVIPIRGMKKVKLPNIPLSTSQPTLIQLGVELTFALKEYYERFVPKGSKFPKFYMEETNYLVKWGDNRWQSTYTYKSAKGLTDNIVITMIFNGMPPWANTHGLPGGK